MILDALDSDDLTDLEDSLQIQSAIREQLDYIITRNIKDFTQSEVKAMLPEDFLKQSGMEV